MSTSYIGGRISSEVVDSALTGEVMPMAHEEPTIAETPHEQPFDEIAISLSGGGYRAAAFHLGALDMLYRIDLLHSVRVLSTVSGGTFTGLKYALSAAEGDGFEKCYRECYDFLADTNVIGGALGGFQPSPGSSFAGQMPSLIRGAARVYTSPKMFGDRTFDSLLTNQTSHLKELSFNATEFRTGNYFRFQRSESAGALIGNRNLEVKKPVARMIRLADIAAASSCFPSAFEPIRFPDDFLWPENLEQIRSTLGPKFTQCVALMDGGIYDNQGVDSILQAYKRVGNRVGLVIISDTSQRSASLFEFEPERKRGWLTLSAILRLAWIVFFIAVLTTMILILAGLRSISTIGLHLYDAFLYGVPIILSTFVAGALYWGRRRFREGQERVAQMTTLELWPYLKRLTIPELFDLIDGRVKSLIALTASVFMKRVRGLIYKDISVNEKYRDRHFSNLVYDLDDTAKFNDAVVEKLAPTEQFRQLARVAEDVETSLWLKGPEDLRNLVACGQVTTCFNLLRYILEKRAIELQIKVSQEHGIYKKADTLWNALKGDPYTLLR
jgi:predicted acylesterase/phospholipase RssA